MDVPTGQTPNHAPLPPYTSSSPSRATAWVMLVAGIIFILIVGWYYVTYPHSKPTQVLEPLSGELDYFSFSPIVQTGKPPLEGIIKYTAADGSTGILPQSFTMPIVGVSFSPLRDSFVFVSEASSTRQHGSVLTFYSLVTRKTTVLTQGAGMYLAPSWSGDGKTILYLQVAPDAASTETMGTYSLTNKKTTTLGAGVPIGLSYDGKSVLFDGADTRLHIQSATTSAVVSDPLLLGAAGEAHPLISVALSPDRQYVAIMGPAKTFIAKIDWLKNALVNQTLIPTAYGSGAFNQKDELMLVTASSTADVYTPGGTGFTKGVSYIVPAISYPSTVLSWVSTQ